MKMKIIDLSCGKTLTSMSPYYAFAYCNNAFVGMRVSGKPEENTLAMYVYSRCRESAASFFCRESPYIGFFSCEKKSYKNQILDLLGRIEEHCGFEDRTEVINCDNESLNLIRPAKRWLSNNMMNGFFTLFLRAACEYHVIGEDIMHTMGKYPLAREILHAIKHIFVDLNLTPTFEVNSYITGHGLVSYFRSKSPSEINNTFIRIHTRPTYIALAAPDEEKKEEPQKKVQETKQ